MAKKLDVNQPPHGEAEEREIAAEVAAEGAEERSVEKMVEENETQDQEMQEEAGPQTVIPPRLPQITGALQVPQGSPQRPTRIPFEVDQGYSELWDTIASVGGSGLTRQIAKSLSGVD